MAYQALYRTYRPQFFREVVGQDVVVKTLQNAIANGKISHAYLFCGPRGTGKTTIARIFAKTLNCENPILHEPCDKCNSCHEISDTMSPDVIEIDAASNNGVDEIREIRDKVKFLPGGAKYKIYIIDEVHMLSAGAFNALLKTLEEPPHHVVFILATTEVQKLPATIISRCQRFDFKSLSVGEISNKLRLVCGSEEISVTEEAINAISESAEGALRDALSTLDMAISYSENEVTIEEVNLVTGNLSYDKLIEVASSFNLGDVNGALEIIDQLLTMGKEVPKLVSSLLQFYRDMLLYKNVTSPVYSKYIFEKEKFKELALSTQVERIFYYIEVLNDVLVKIKYSQTPRIYLEIAIIKMINMSSEDLNFIKRIEDLENKINNIDFNQSQAPIEIDNEKVNLLEIKINRVVSELNKLELHKLVQKVEEMSITIPTTNSTETFELEKQVKSINESLLILKTSYNSLLNQVNQNTSSNNSFNINNDLNLDKIKQEVSLDLKNSIDNFQSDLNSIKIKITDIENTNFNEENNKIAFNDLKEKFELLEKKVYKLISDDLANKDTPVIKKQKKSTEQIVLFKDDLTPIQEFDKTKVNVNFNDLAKNVDNEEEDIIKEYTDSDVEIKQDQNVKYFPNADKKANQETLQDYQETVVVVQDNNEQENAEENNTIEEEVINSEVVTIKENPNSRLVITPKNNSSIFENERQLMEKEMSAIRPSINLTSKTLPNEDVKDVRINNLESQNEIDRYLTYDSKIIETILHESRSEDARNDAKRINQLWNNLSRGVRKELLGVVDILKEGRIAAVGNKEFIIVFKSTALCNQVMRKSFKNDALKIMFDNLRDTYNYMALPEHLWTEKRTEYINQYNIGIKYPKLTPIYDPELVVFKPIPEYQNPKDKIVDDAVSFFGDDIVKIE